MGHLRGFAFAFALGALGTASAEPARVSLAARVGLQHVTVEYSDASLERNSLVYEAEVDARATSWLSVGPFIAYSAFSGQIEQPFGLPNVLMRQRLMTTGVRFNFHAAGFFGGLGVGIESLIFSKSTTNEAALDLHLGYTFPRIGWVSPELIAILLAGLPRDKYDGYGGVASYQLAFGLRF